MGVVYRARQVSLDRVVALKVLPPEMAHDGRAASRFEREARAMARLSHPNIVDVIEVGEQDGIHYFAMQLIRGEPLDDIIRREGALPAARATEIAAQMADALAHAHDAGVIHRDIKPGNIMIEPDGRAIVTDFGIAKAAIDDGAPPATPTLTQGPIGAPAYMSPEVLKGNPVDGRADLYGLGIVLYEMVTGRVPFAAATPYQVATQQLTEQPRPPRSLSPDCPPWLEGIILRSLAKEPADRFGSAAEMAAALRGGEEPSGAVHATGAQRTVGPEHARLVPAAAPMGGPQLSRVPPGVLALAVVGVALLAAAAAIVGIGALRPPPVTVPNVTGMAVSQALLELQEAGLAGERSGAVHDPIAEGQVTAQAPSADASVVKGSTVELIVSLGPDLVSAGEEIDTTYREIDAVLSEHYASNQPWEAWKSIHGNTSSSWHAYVMARSEELIRSDESLVESYETLAGRVRSVSVPDTAPASFSEMRDLLARGCDAGADRCAKSAELIRRELAGSDPSWRENTPYGQAKRRHEELLGETGPIGGRARRYHDGAFYPDLERVRQQ